MGGLLGFKEQKAFEKSVFDKIRRGAGAWLVSRVIGNICQVY